MNYHSTLQQAKLLIEQENFKDACTLLQESQDNVNDPWHSFYLIKSLRRTGKFDRALDLALISLEKYENFPAIESEYLWVLYDGYIKGESLENMLFVAEKVFTFYDPKNKFILYPCIKTAIYVSYQLSLNGDYKAALQWLLRLDYKLISNRPYIFQEVFYPSDQKRFFLLLAEILIKDDSFEFHIESLLNEIGFSEVRTTSFINYIKKNVIENGYSIWYLGKLLKLLMDEVNFRHKTIQSTSYNRKSIALISELSDFVFCPASYAIKQTLGEPDNLSWQVDEWGDRQLSLYDRFINFQQSKQIHTAFPEAEIDKIKANNMFNTIFKSVLISCSSKNINSKVHYSLDKTLCGNPDYIFENNLKERFVVVEKFTSHNSESLDKPFNNDLIKIIAYILGLKDLGLSFGYLIYWHFKPVREILGTKQVLMNKIIDFKIFKIPISAPAEKLYKSYSQSFFNFLGASAFKVDLDKVSYPAKCLNCSVFEYCELKTGKNNIINLPYKHPNQSLSSNSNSADSPSFKKYLDNVPEELWGFWA